MKRTNINAKVILIGSNNGNGLGLVRTLGVNGIKPYGIITGKKDRDYFLGKSKYWKDSWYVDDAQDALELLIEKFGEVYKSGEKPLVIPYADSVLTRLDQKYDYFSEMFILPSFAKEQGRIYKLSNKEEQTSFARKLGLQMLDSEIITAPFDNICTFKLPVILKPVVSAEGDKADTIVCYSENDLRNAKELLLSHRYNRILVQPYLKKRIEYVAFGAMNPDNHFCSYTIIKNIRQWPKEHGVGCYSEYVTSGKIVSYVDDVFRKLLEMNYDSPVDIEIFEDENGEFYINEFNWRIGGRNYTALNTRVFSSYWWVCCKLSLPLEKDHWINTMNGTTMREGEDIRYAIYHDISWHQWISDFFNCKSFGLWFIRDPLPAIDRYGTFFKHMVKKNKIAEG